ncbi:MAG: hypothetical protein M1827_004169 [Pycnora praestabilis]|nr:MAG: hypothetical protein M1827_004169 [Pycnora praestabilis]
MVKTAPAKRRRTTSAITSASSLLRSQDSLHEVGRISKPLVLPEQKSKDDPIKDSLIVTTCRGIPALGKTNAKKRKLFAAVEQERVPLEEAYPAATTSSFDIKEEIPISGKCDVNSVQSSLLSTGSTSLQKNGLQPKITTKGTHQSLNTLNSSTSASASVSTPVSLNRSHVNPRISPVPAQDPQGLSTGFAELPEALQDLVDLQSSFLTALSLHYAHNGSLAPADLRNLVTSIERLWGRRRVNIEDIQRLIGVWESEVLDGHKTPMVSQPCGLSLMDYGSGKLCLETAEEVRKHGLLVRHIDESTFNSTFIRNLERMWLERERTAAQKKGGSDLIDGNGDGETEIKHCGLQRQDLDNFITKLPLAPITICSSVRKMSPLLARGQRRLEYLKAGAIRIKNQGSEKGASSFSERAPKAIKDRNRVLIERMRAKEVLSAEIPQPPSKENLERRSALQRLDEVISVLTVLTTSGESLSDAELGRLPTGNRASFTLPTLLQNLQTSLKNPISKDQGMKCIRLLASEIAPEWIRLITMGKVTGVVVSKGFRPIDLDIKARINTCK